MKSKYPNEVENTLQTMEASDPYAAEIALREAYDMEFGIFDHPVFDPNNPLMVPLVGIHRKEDRKTNSYFDLYTRKYLQYNFRETYGMSVTEYFELPFDRAADLIRLAEDHVNLKSKLLDNMKQKNEKDQQKAFGQQPKR